MDRDTELDAIAKELEALIEMREGATRILKYVTDRAFILNGRINELQAQADLGREQTDEHAEVIQFADIQKGAI